MMMKPTVGRIVHYVFGEEYDGAECHAAIVTAVGAQDISLCVINVADLRFLKSVRYDDGASVLGSPSCPLPHEDGPHRYCVCGWIEAGYTAGSWHWPEREADLRAEG